MTAPRSRDAAPAKRRGRKPRASQDEIVRAAVELLEREPHEPLTMARVAEGVGLAPMTLYRYFEDRDALMTAIARAVIEGREPLRFPKRATWQDKVRTWMFSIRDNLVRYPQVLQLTATGGYQGWLVDGAELVAILETVGEWADDDLARALFWVSTTTLGHVILEANKPASPSTSALYTELGRLPEPAAAEMARVIPELGRLRDGGFALAVELTVAALEDMVPGAAGRR